MADWERYLRPGMSEEDEYREDRIDRWLAATVFWGTLLFIALGVLVRQLGL